MADDVKEFSREEAQGLMFHGAPQPSMAAPVSISNIPLPPPVKVSDSTKGSPVAKKIDSFALVEKVGTANKKLQEQMVKPEAPSAMHELVDQISNNWKPLGIGALVVATAYGAARLLGGKKPIESLEGKPLTGKGPTQRIEPTFATPEETAVFKPVEQPIGPSQLDQDAAMIAKSEQAKLDKIRYAQEQEAIRKARFGAPQVSDVQARNQAAEFRARQLNPVPPPPPPLPSISNAVATGGNVTQAVNEDIAKDIDAETTKKVTSVSPDTAIKVEGLVRDAQGNFQYPPGMSPGAIQAHKAFVQQYPEIAASLEAQGKFGMVGGGAADNSLKNTYGVDLRKQILNEVNQGQMGGINKDYLEKINPAIKALSPETGLGKTLAELKINNPKGGIKGPLGVPATIGSSGELVSSPPGKVSSLINKGSKALLLMSMFDAANAAQKGNTAPAKEVGFDLASGYALAKLLGGPAAAAAALALGSSGLNSNEQQDLEYRRRVGGGRGIAPPSAYFR